MRKPVPFPEEGLVHPDWVYPDMTSFMEKSRKHWPQHRYRFQDLWPALFGSMLTLHSSEARIFHTIPFPQWKSVAEKRLYMLVHQDTRKAEYYYLVNTFDAKGNCVLCTPTANPFDHPQWLSPRWVNALIIDQDPQSSMHEKALVQHILHPELASQINP